MEYKVDYNKLRSKFVENGLTVVQVSEIMGINKDTFYRRVRNGGSKLRLEDMWCLINLLKLSEQDVSDIFVAEKKSK